MTFNRALRIFAKETLFKLFSVLNRWIQKKENRLLLYSSKDLSDNLKSLFLHLMNNDYLDQFEVVVSATDWQQLQGKYPNQRAKFISPMAGIFAFFRARVIFYAFGKIPIVPCGQRVVQMWHGNFIKDFDYYQKRVKQIEHYYTDVLVTDKQFIPLAMQMHHVEEGVVKVHGQSRTDIFYDQTLEPFMSGQYVVWLPTFRQSDQLGYNDSSFETSDIGDYTFEELVGLDALLGQLQLKLVVKLHPMQNLQESYYNQRFEHITIFTDGIKGNFEGELYHLLKDSVALVTDYSSVFYDYYLLNKPIAFCCRDFEDYKANRGFIFDNPWEYMIGQKIEQLEDFKAFLTDVANQTDRYQSERQDANRRFNFYQDGQNTKRLLDAVGVIKKN